MPTWRGVLRTMFPMGLLKADDMRANLLRGLQHGSHKDIVGIRRKTTDVVCHKPDTTP